MPLWRKQHSRVRAGSAANYRARFIAISRAVKLRNYLADTIGVYTLVHIGMSDESRNRLES